MQGVKRPSRTSSSAWDAVSPHCTAASAVESEHVVAISSAARIAYEIGPIDRAACALGWLGRQQT